MTKLNSWVAVLVGIMLLPNLAASANSVTEACKKGKACLDKEDFASAVAAFTEALRIDPKLPEGYLGRGAAYLMKGNPDKAITDFTEAIRLDPKYAKAYYYQGVTVHRPPGTGSFFGRFNRCATFNARRPKNVPVPLRPRGTVPFSRRQSLISGDTSSRPRKLGQSP